jgi:hypothetical protein
MTIALKKPEKGLEVNLADEPVVLKTVTGAPAENDLILEFASMIEKVKTATKLEEIIKNLSDEREFDFFKLGGAIARAQALFDKSKPEFAGYKSFREFVETVYGDYGKALHAAKIYKKLVDLEIPWSAVEEIGWTKIRVLLDVVTKENVKQWVAQAKGMNFPTLKAHVKAEKQKSKSGTEEAPKPVASKTFQLHEDQKEAVNAALEKIKEESGTPFDSAALEYLAQNYLGAGI